MTQIYYLTKQGLPVDANGKPVVIEEAAAEQIIVTNETHHTEDLMVIKGIGPARVKELAQHGVDSFQRLAMAHLDELGTAMEVSPATLAEWQNKAAKMVQV